MSTINIKTQLPVDMPRPEPKMAKVETDSMPLKEVIESSVANPQMKQVLAEQFPSAADIEKNTIVFSSEGLQVLNAEQEVVFQYPSKEVSRWYEVFKNLNMSNMPKVEA